MDFMELSQLLLGLDYEINNEKDLQLDVNDIIYDSRKAQPETLFLSIHGIDLNGDDYVLDAYERGCRIFILEQELQDLPTDTTVVLVSDTRQALSKMSANFFGHPSKEMTVVGVTGTKGKTTVANYIKKVLCGVGINAGVIGTMGIFYNDQEIETINTTPESYELNKTMRAMLDAGVTAVAMEVSSGGLMMNRVDDIDFDIGIFTNLSLDHIGPREHPTFEHYRDCKSRLFNLCKYGIINADDEYAEYMIEHATCPTTTYSVHHASDYQAHDIQLTRDGWHLGVAFTYDHKGEKTQTHISTPGEFSVLNALAVLATTQYLGVPKDEILKTLSRVTIDGRVEVLPVLDDVTVVIDFAHNGISLENVLTTLLDYHPKHLICVFGSIGNRAIIRRKELGDVAAKYCDVAVLTADNPDREDPQIIIDEIAESFVDSKCKVLKIADRSEAMYEAMKLAQPGDMVVIAGKGHEKYQVIDGKHVFYDERAEVIKAAERVKKEK
ncbi:UDP-N-acetylmuramoylalanyl-D-glutamate--2,6-diami nopimelate ligase [Ligilactobacillus ceti DSM 22408]|uniref:UDP-N-acetylmuramyl-tripeptide synthetase n=2 Tax=Ligilactobacillus TaxID=2767887 RepID=A0A0R2KHV7_9LACO|nr:UDP-N-acetylmuramoylalanyl-D-glutamate--2,6-diami nopimelate ligase [Ligilactobacillus ceti DSM 22408]